MKSINCLRQIKFEIFDTSSIKGGSLPFFRKTHKFQMISQGES
ncbi:hypothetical protein P4K71_09445 [Bacillus cereus]|nr:hypothetical protein [Bacillus thuringiensis]MCU5283156.1 hypothetical protein [Bacillus cereus]MEB8736456.1 hypothetical protein [Bacillus cereus]MEB8905284.1 hypothetical protein [Bacillus cereus]MEB9923041.1 hypothetical protein [Bacillus cereus]MEB9986213.1 hypothetical protein [Bacillus cereus]